MDHEWKVLLGAYPQEYTASVSYFPHSKEIQIKPHQLVLHLSLSYLLKEYIEHISKDKESTKDHSCDEYYQKPSSPAISHSSCKLLHAERHSIRPFVEEWAQKCALSLLYWSKFRKFSNIRVSSCLWKLFFISSMAFLSWPATMSPAFFI